MPYNNNLVKNKDEISQALLLPGDRSADDFFQIFVILLPTVVVECPVADQSLIKLHVVDDADDADALTLTVRPTTTPRTLFYLYTIYPHSLTYLFVCCWTCSSTPSVRPSCSFSVVSEVTGDK